MAAMRAPPARASALLAALLVLHAAFCDRIGLALAGCDKGYSHDGGVMTPSPGPNWMRQLYDHTPLSQMSVLGTHDTMAFTTGGDSVLTQSMSLRDQLYSGIRALDIRCRPSGDWFAIHHGVVYLNANFHDVLNTAKAFLTVNPTETIIMRIKEEHERSKETTMSFENIFLRYYNDLTYRSIFWSYDGSNNNPLLRDIRGKIVILDNMPGGASRKYGPEWGALSIQDDSTVATICDLGWKWGRVTDKFNAASTTADFSAANHNRIHVNFLSASTGSFPYFFASGKSSPGTCDNALACWCPFTSKCSVTGFWAGPFGNMLYKGINELTYDWPVWSTTSPRRTGIVMADFPDGNLIQRITEQNSIIYTDVVYNLRPAHIGGLSMCLDLPAGNMAQGVQLLQWECHQGFNQRFTFVKYNSSNVLFDGYSQFVEIKTAAGRCLEVPGASKDNMARMQTGQCNGSGAQRFIPVPRDGGFAFININSRKCLDITGLSASNGGALIQWECTNNPNQVFKLRRNDPSLINHISTITISDGFWGDWMTAQYCAGTRSDGIKTGQKMTGFTLRQEASCGSCDDTALNGLRMTCTVGPSTITFAEGLWGTWASSTTSCASGAFITGARLRLEKQQGGGDDTAANSIEFMCSDGRAISQGAGSWGDWGSWVTCPAGAYVCGAQARFEGSQGGGDDTAFNGLRLVCCGSW